MRKINQFLIIGVLSSQLLTGCVPAALVAGAAVGGVVVYDRRSLRESFVDREITRRSLYALRNTKALAGKSHLSVAADNRVVLLTGQAQTPELKALAKQVVSSVPNIKKIYNEIQVSGNNSFMDRTNDSWITTKVKTAMLREKGLKSSDIKVVTESGVVYLMGTVTRSQVDLATRVVRRVGGVKMVVKIFQYEQADQVAANDSGSAQYADAGNAATGNNEPSTAQANLAPAEAPTQGQA